MKRRMSVNKSLYLGMMVLDAVDGIDDLWPTQTDLSATAWAIQYRSTDPALSA